MVLMDVSSKFIIFGFNTTLKVIRRDLSAGIVIVFVQKINQYIFRGLGFESVGPLLELGTKRANFLN